MAVRRSRLVTLDECIAMARQNYPRVEEARARYKRSLGDIREAHTAPFSEFTVIGGAGIAPVVRGTSSYSPNSDAALTNNMALAYQIGIEGMVPLWTFGKLSSLWEAVDAASDAKRHEVVKEQNVVEMEVRRAFYGTLLARDGRALLGEARGELQKALDALEQKVADGEADDVDVLKLSMFQAELEARSSEAARNEEVALLGLTFLTGSKEPLEIENRPLERLPHELGPLAVYLEAARLHRPELNMVTAGLRARKAQVEMERARFFPDVGLVLSAKLVRAPEITDQRNPFAYDPANAAFYGMGLAMRWKLDFLPQAARIMKAEADLEEMRATERFAIGGIAFEVEEAYRLASDAKRRLDAWHRAAQFAKRWLIKVQQGSELGLTEQDEFVEPAKEYALKRFSEMSAVFDYNVALARLALATGWSALLSAPEGR